MSLFKVTRQELNWGGKKLVLETGRIARQADGAVLATYGGTSVLVTVVAAKDANPDIDFFPLSVHYQEKAFAVGKIPGGFFKREGKPSEKETLTSRLIDRPVRPLFPEGFLNEVQVIATVLSYDGETDSDIVALIGASAALSISGIPFLGPIAAARVGYHDGKYTLNHPACRSKGQLDLVVAGTSVGVLMVESEAHELSEEIMLEAVVFGHKELQPVIQMIESFKERCGKPAWDLSGSVDCEALVKVFPGSVEKDIKKAYGIAEKQERRQAIQEIKSKALDAAAEKASSAHLAMAFKKIEAKTLREDIIDKEKRIDGRRLNEVRPIEVEVGILPRTHGSALFTRGETQALVVTTLGTAQDEQIIDCLEGEYRERFLLHYNFPPYSVGETGRVSSPGRREIGHGKLAWRAVHPLLPAKEKFPYSIRAVSEITESNGSSSMATVCGASLSLMDAGVPLLRPLAGIAMGLVKEGEKFAVLSDISGDEDALGDMDFKVAGTSQGITALQMDIKITSITPEIMKQALEQAKEGRLHILKSMSSSLTEHRGELSTHAPKVTSFKIGKDKIREVIGAGGKTIREICETTGAKIDIEDDGTVNVSGVDPKSIDAAIDAIKNIACDPEVGTIYTGKVVKIMEFGAFVNFLGNRDGLVHISELSTERVQRVNDIVSVGDVIKVKVLGFDDRGKVKLSLRAAMAGFHEEGDNDRHPPRGDGRGPRKRPRDE